MNVAVRVFGSCVYTSLSGPMMSSHISEDANEFDSLHEKEVLECCDMWIDEPPLIVDDLQPFREESLEKQVKQAQEHKEVSFSSDSKNPGQFKQFDMVSDCSEHHFIDGGGKGLILSQVKNGWLKKVQQEWSILEKDLPDTIYVRVYEERIDLLGAVIVGAPGTPYHDGLFFFDFFLPSEYPNEPPI
ncbi:hypothetical protein HHK36_023272 [Tetracentron sinense]|uniref:UBC core domain-containing protein n=1 Tax=Tetracentron sinense TaxID=13715 RepID=A0A834YM95_TETSI|nr:hypothetical protein HHK36_023272 [Tetracentron sinense]